MNAAPAVFVHGLIGSFSEPAALDALHPRPTSAPDLNGYGTGGTEAISVRSQVDSLQGHLRARYGDVPVHLIAHSIGAVYAFTYAAEHPRMVASIVNVEGNFSLADAFWSQSIAAMSEAVARTSVTVSLSDPRSWLRDAGVGSSAENLNRASHAVSYQSWRTVWASAKTIVATTGDSRYEEMLRSVFEEIPVHLVAGERSASDWHIPNWAREQATSNVVIPGVGHMMMLEEPRKFGAEVARLLGSR
jgi:pimeloyl-ACP methyl ester carboxylesterase